MASKIGKREWGFIIAATGALDAVQWLVDFIPVYGEIVNAVADPIIGVSLTVYLWIRGVNLFYKPKRVLAIVAGGLAEEVSLEVLPAWVMDAWYIRNDVLQEEAAEEQAREQQALVANIQVQPLYKDGVRMPPAQTATTNTVSSKKSNTVTVNSGVVRNGVRVVVGSPRTGNTMSGGSSNTATTTYVNPNKSAPEEVEATA